MTKLSAIKELTKKIETAWAGLHLLEKLLPDDSKLDFPVDVQTTINKNRLDIHIVLPYNIDCLRQYRRAMGSGWKAFGEWCDTNHNDCSSHHQSFYRPELGRYYDNPLHVSIAMRTNIEKSVCHIEQVGVIELPKWKVVCDA